MPRPQVECSAITITARKTYLWTQDDGHLLAYVAGPVHEDVWNWWLEVHHNIGFSGPRTHM